MARSSQRLIALGITLIVGAAICAYRLGTYHESMPIPVWLGWGAFIGAIFGAKCLEMAINGGEQKWP